MGLPQLKQAGYSVEDWKTWEGRWELINGEAFAMAPPTLEHQRVSRFLSQAIGVVLDEKAGSGRGELRGVLRSVRVVPGRGGNRDGTRSDAGLRPSREILTGHRRPAGPGGGDPEPFHRPEGPHPEALDL